MNSKLVIPAAIAVLALSACSSSKAPEGNQPQTQQAVNYLKSRWGG